LSVLIAVQQTHLTGKRKTHIIRLLFLSVIPATNQLSIFRQSLKKSSFEIPGFFTNRMITMFLKAMNKVNPIHTGFRPYEALSITKYTTDRAGMLILMPPEVTAE
jgi:hypothetical protein